MVLQIAHDTKNFEGEITINPLTPTLKTQIPSKNMCERPANTPIIHSVY
jgi:hypothetical protein